MDGTSLAAAILACAAMPAAAEIRVILLGTGTPVPSAERRVPVSPSFMTTRPTSSISISATARLIQAWKAKGNCVKL